MVHNVYITCYKYILYLPVFAFNYLKQNHELARVLWNISYCSPNSLGTFLGSFFPYRPIHFLRYYILRLSRVFAYDNAYDIRVLNQITNFRGTISNNVAGECMEKRNWGSFPSTPHGWYQPHITCKSILKQALKIICDLSLERDYG